MEHRTKKYLSYKKVIVILIIINFILCFFSLFGWQHPVYAIKSAASLLTGTPYVEGIQIQATRHYILNYILPLNLGIIITGAALSLSGAVYQSIFKNPMSSPDVLGASAGGSLGGALYIYFFSVAEDAGMVYRADDVTLTIFSSIAKQFFILCFAVGAVMLVMYISYASDRKFYSTSTMLLVGMVISSLCNSILTFIRYMITLLSPDDTRLPDLNAFLYGNLLNLAQIPNLIKLLIPVGLFSIPLLFMRYRLNLFVFDVDEAKSMGVNIRPLRMIIILCSTMLTASTIAVVGQIGWIGMIVPHVSRLLVGSDYKKSLPVAMLLGGLFLLVAEAITTYGNFPISIYTSIIGVPVFLYFLYTARKRGNRAWS